MSKRKIWIGFIFSLILRFSIIAIFYVGGTREIKWLCIVGFGAVIIDLIIDFLSGRGTIMPVKAILYSLLTNINILNKILSYNNALSWVVNGGTTGIFYYSRAIVLPFFLATLIMIGLSIKSIIEYEE